MANFWIQDGEWARGGNNSVRFGDLVKPFGRKYKGMWRVFEISENGEIMLVSDECVGEVTLEGMEGYNKGIDLLDQLCIDTIKSSKVAAVRSITCLDLKRVRKYDENLNIYRYKPDYWLATSYICSSGVCGIHSIYDGRVMSQALYLYGGTECKFTLGVKAVVTLRKNVEFTKTKDGYWKI